MTQDARLLIHAAKMRHEGTPIEVILWRHLSRSQLGHKFRRQHVIDKHIVDFFCPAKSLAIEVDGLIHGADEMRQRDNELGTYGVHVLHFSSEDIARNMEGVLIRIQELLAHLPDRWTAPTSTLPLKGRGLSAIP